MREERPIGSPARRGRPNDEDEGDDQAGDDAGDDAGGNIDLDDNGEIVSLS